MTEPDMSEKVSCCSTGGATTQHKVMIVLAVGIILYVVACLLPFIWPMDGNDFRTFQRHSLLTSNLSWLAIALIVIASFGWIRQSEK
jgi:hypothetical protein